MNIFKSTLYGFAALAFAAGVLTACQDDVDAPAVNIPVASSTPNTTLAEFKEMFWQDDNNYCVHAINPEDPDARIIIHGRVTTSDEESNVFKFLVIQDETAALTFSIDSYNLYLNYRRGQEIVMDVTDMFVGKYAGQQQMGDSSYYDVQKTPQVTFMSLERFQAKAELNGVPEVSKLDTLPIETFAELLTNTPAVQRKYQSQLVRLKNVSFEDAGKKKFSEYHVNTNEAQNRNIIDRNGQSIIVRTSGYSTFWNEILPEGNLDITGTLTYFNGSWRLILNDRDGVVEVGNRPGTRENPYNVDDVVALEAADNTDRGWVRGYIVGAVAPEVESVGANTDIEWEAPTVLANTLVIGPTSDTNDFSKCLVVALPAESALRQYGNLRNNPDNLGKEIYIQGSFEKYMDTWGITGNNGTVSEFEIEGITVDTGEVPAGAGTEASPYNVAQIVALNPTSTTTAVETGVWVKGYIVGSMPTGGSSTTLSGTEFGLTDAAATNLVLGPTPDCTDYTKCIGIQLSTTIRGELALANKPENLGKVLEIKGDVMKYCGGPGIKNGAEYKLSGADNPNPPTPPAGEGSGTKEDPYSTAKIISLNPTSTTVAVETGIWAQGYIVGSMPTGGSSTTLSGTVFGLTDAAATNLVLGPDPNCTDYTQCIGVQLPTSIRGELALANKPENLGKKLAIKGDVMKYCGGPGIKNTSEFVLDGGTTPDPTPSTVTSLNVTFDGGTMPAGWSNVQVSGDKAWYVTSFDNNFYAAMTGYKGTTPPFDQWLISPAIDLSQVSDKVLTFDSQVNGYGSTTTTFGVYVLTSANPATGNPAALNATIATAPASGYSGFVNSGNVSLAAYSGTVYIGFRYYATQDANYATWCVDNIKLNAGSTPDPNPNPNPNPDPNPNPGSAVEFNATTMTVPGITTVGGISVDIEKADGKTAPTLHAGTSAIRTYASNTMAFSGAKMSKIVFTINTGSMKYRYTDIIPSTGTITPAQAAGDTTVTWVGDASEVTFTVGALGVYGSEPEKPGQFHFTKIEVYPAN